MTLSLHQLGCLSKRRFSSVGSWTLFSLHPGPFICKEGSWVLLQGLAVRFRYGAGEGPGTQGPADDLQPEPPILSTLLPRPYEDKRKHLWNIKSLNDLLYPLLYSTEGQGLAQHQFHQLLRRRCRDMTGGFSHPAGIYKVSPLGRKWQCQKVSVPKFRSSEGRLCPLHT